MSDIKNKISDLLSPYANELEDARLGEFLTLSVGRILLKNPNSLQTISKDELRHITDWLKATIINNESWLSNLDTDNRPKKLMKFNSIEGIVKEVNKVMLVEAQKLLGIKLVEGDEELFMKLNDGYYVVKLLTPAALDKESATMQHCIGGGAYDCKLKNSNYKYLSLRDSSGKPHTTMEIYFDEIQQMQGKQNQPPLNKYQHLLLPLITEHKLNMKFLPAFKYVLDTDTGNWHDIYNLPDNFTVKGSLLYNNEDERQIILPKNLTIEGELHLNYTNIKYLPEGLKVMKNLSIFHTEIKEIPDDLYVKETLQASNTLIKHYKPRAKKTPKNVCFQDCVELESITDNLHVKGLLFLEGCKKLLNLPNNLKVKENLIIVDTNITSLPDDINVGKIHIKYNQNIIIPPNISNDINFIVESADNSWKKMTLQEYKELTNQNVQMKL